MLAPDYLDHAPDRLVLLWQQVEDDILRDVARRISKMEALTPTANWQLWRYEQTEALRQDVVKKLARYTGKSEAEIRRLMQEAATQAMEAEDEIYYHYGKEPTPFADNATLQALLNAGYQQTAGTFHNLTATTANTVSGQFEAALDRAHLKVSSGAFDYKSAVKSAVDSLADTMKYVTYPTGHTDTLEVAARRAVLTGVNQTGAKLQVARADEMGVEFFETTAHGGARPSTLSGRAGSSTGVALWTTWASITRTSRPPPATAPGPGFAAGTVGISSFRCSRSWVHRLRGRRRLGSPQRPGHRVQRRQIHPVRDQPDAAGPGTHRAQVQTPVSGRGCRRGRHHRQRGEAPAGPSGAD